MPNHRAFQMDAGTLEAKPSQMLIVTNENELALLSLAAVRPLADLPPFHRSIVARLESRGLMRCEGGRWHPTAAGLRLIRRALH